MTNFSSIDLSILTNLFGDRSPETNKEREVEYSKALIRISAYVKVLEENTTPTESYPLTLTPIFKGTQKVYKVFDKIIETLSTEEVKGDDELNAFKQALHFRSEDSEYVNNIINQIQELREDIEATSNFNTRGSQGRQLSPFTAFHASLIKLYRKENNGKVNYTDHPDHSLDNWLTGPTIKFIEAVYIKHHIQKTDSFLTQIKNAINSKK